MNIIVIILYALVYVIVFVVGIIWKGFAWIFSLFDIHMGNGIDVNNMDFQPANIQNQITSNAGSGPDIWPKVFLLVLFLVACFIFFRILSKKSNNISYSRSGVSEEIINVNYDRPISVGTPKSIRKYYRKHMINLEKNGSELDSYSTTTDVLHEDGYSKESVDLCNLYRRARYSDEQLTSEEVHIAKKLIKHIEKSKEQ